MNIFSLAHTGSWPFCWTTVFQSPGLVPFTCLLLRTSRACCTCYSWVTPLNWRWSPINHTAQSQGQHFSWDLMAEWKGDASLFFAKRLHSSGGCQCRALIKSTSLPPLKICWWGSRQFRSDLPLIRCFFFFFSTPRSKGRMVFRGVTCDRTQDQAWQVYFTDRQAPLLHTVIWWMRHLTDHIHLHNLCWCMTPGNRLITVQFYNGSEWLKDRQQLPSFIAIILFCSAVPPIKLYCRYIQRVQDSLIIIIIQSHVGLIIPKCLMCYLIYAWRETFSSSPHWFFFITIEMLSESHYRLFNSDFS